MEHYVNDHKKFDFGNTGLDDAEEEWTEPLNHEVEVLQQNCAENTADISKGIIPVPKLGHSRTIIHFDIDCFYAQVEMLRNPELRNKPLGIQQKNIVITTNYIARNCGVPKSTYVTDAKKICPELVLVCGEDLTNYRQMSYQISEFLQRYTGSVERLGFDENFIDVSELVTARLKDGKYKNKFVGHVYSSDQQGITKPQCNCGCEIRLQIGSQIAADIRDALKKELGITCCAGVSHNKLLAKLVAGTHKPNQQTSILPHMALELMSSLSSVLSIPGIGFTTNRRLNAHGISSVLDLQACDRKILEKEFGSSMVHLIVQLSYGVDDSPVTAYSQPQTLSDEDSFKCCNDLADAEHKIRDLLTSLMKRVVEDGRDPQTVRLTVRRMSNKYNRESKQCPIPGNIFTKCRQSCVTVAVVERLMPLLMNLFHKLVDTSKPFHLTLIGVCFAKLVKPADELGSIGTFFTREAGVDLSDKVLENVNENECQPVSKSSPLKVKHESNIRTLKYFFSVEDNETQASRQNLGWKVDGNASSHTSVNVSSAADVKEKSINMDFSKSHKNKDFLSLHGTKGCSTDSDQVLKASIVKTTPVRHTESSSSASDVPDSSFTHTEQDTLQEKCLQALLPAEVDAHTITELPVDIQKEVLLQYGIIVEDFPQQRFTLSDSIRTRSHTLNPAVVRVNKSLCSPRKKNTTKRSADISLLCSEAADRHSKRKKNVCVGEVPHTNIEACQQLHAADSGVGENTTEISSKALNTNYAKNESLLCVRDSENKQKSETYMHPSTGCDTAVEISRKSNADKCASCADDISPRNQFNGTKNCLLHDQHAYKPVVNCDLDTSYEDLELEPSSHNMPDIHADCQGASLDTSMLSPPSPNISVQSCSSASAFSYQNSQRKVQKKLPSNFDSEVFLSLPSNIQGEIMAHIVMGSSDSVSGQHTTNEIPECPRNLKQTKSIKHKAQNTLLTYFKRSDTENKKVV